MSIKRTKLPVKKRKMRTRYSSISAEELHDRLLADLRAFCLHHSIVCRAFDNPDSRPLEQTIRMVCMAVMMKSAQEERERDFDAGILWAAARLVEFHDQPTLAKELLIQSGTDPSKATALDAPFIQQALD